jgi:hypothetical protein
VAGWQRPPDRKRRARLDEALIAQPGANQLDQLLRQMLTARGTSV